MISKSNYFLGCNCKIQICRVLTNTTLCRSQMFIMPSLVELTVPSKRKFSIDAVAVNNADGLFVGLPLF